MKDNAPYFRNTNLRFTPISHQEEIDLFTTAKTAKNPEERQEARDFLIFNHRLFALRYARKLAMMRIPDDEVGSAAMEAIMTTIDTFDPQRNVRYLVYLRKFIKGAVSKRVFAVMELSKHVREEVRFFELPSNETSVEDLDFSRYKTEVLMSAMDSLTSRQQIIIHCHYMDGVSLTDIAKKWKVSRALVSFLHTRALRKLRTVLEDSEL